MSKGKAIIFSAPSGAGKTTLVHHLLGIDDLKLSFSVSATTRAKRGHEVDGKDYHFLDIASFQEKIKQGDFVEWEEVYKDQFYGTLKSEIERIWSEGRNVIFDVDVLGGINLKKIFGVDAFAVFVRPPSLEVLRFRLRNRSTETSDKIAMRIEKAQSELAYENQFDAVIVNDVLEDALKQAEDKVRQFLSQ